MYVDEVEPLAVASQLSSLVISESQKMKKKITITTLLKKTNDNRIIKINKNQLYLQLLKHRQGIYIVYRNIQCTFPKCVDNTKIWQIYYPLYLGLHIKCNKCFSKKVAVNVVYFFKAKRSDVNLHSSKLNACLRIGKWKSHRLNWPQMSLGSSNTLIIGFRSIALIILKM